MNRVELEPGVAEPRREGIDRGRVVIVEMGAGREDLDGLETVSRNLQQMVPPEPLGVIEVRRDTESSHRQELASDPTGSASQLYFVTRSPR